MYRIRILEATTWDGSQPFSPPLDGQQPPHILGRQLFQLQTAVELRLLADAFDRCHGTNGNHTGSTEAEQCFLGSELVSWLCLATWNMIWMGLFDLRHHLLFGTL